MIKIEKLNVKYGEKVIFDDLNLNIQSNKITGIIAPSGSGKTTLISCITGLKKADSGDVTIDDKTIKSRDIYNDVSMMPQENGLYLSLSAKNNLKYFASLKKIKLTNEEIEKMFKDIGLDKEIDMLVDKYSGGMKRKLSLIITLLGSQSYLFLDEPTVGIDPIYKRLIWEKFKQLRDSKKTLIITTHVMDEAKHCDEIIILDHGKILIQDTLANILKKTEEENLEDSVIKLIKGANNEN